MKTRSLNSFMTAFILCNVCGNCCNFALGRAICTVYFFAIIVTKNYASSRIELK